MKLLYKFSIICIFLSLVAPYFAYSQASSSQNYVMVNTIKTVDIKTAEQVPGLTITTQGKVQTITYFDGLGRPLQSVVTQGSASQKDIVAGSEYDAFGREVKKYLPYADINNTANPGSIKAGWQTNQASFYNGSLQGVDADAAPYSVSVPEASPLNRILAQGAPGAVWQPNTANPYDAGKKVIQFKYEVNVAADNIRIFNLDPAGNISSPGVYGAGLLTVKISIDEHQGMVKEFTDKTGHMLLKQVYIDGDVLQTYYIYDDLDLLRGVIQPEGSAAIPATASWTPDASFLDRWVFQYTYDQRNRMVIKKVPGAKPEFMMYDKWDRLVLTQTTKLSYDHIWLFTKYDALNRPIMTGMAQDVRAMAAIQADIDASGRYETVNTGTTEGYTQTGSYPSSTYILSVFTSTFYDNYSNLPYWNGPYAFVPEYGVSTKNDNLQGQLVGSQTRNLTSGAYLRSVNYYDDKYRLIQTVSDNAAGGKDRITRILSFDGKLLQEYQTHTSNVYTTALVIKKAYSYDHADRLTKVTHKIGTGEEITLVENAYNELGQLLNKKLHQSATFTTPLQKLDYAYNIRGWLNGVNKPFSGSSGYDETDLFNFELHYNTTTQGGSAQYNGNIAEQVWKGGYDEYLRGYKYGYDKANRLKTSSYTYKYLNASNTMVWDAGSKYDENITSYDRNGNIKHLDRYHGSFGKVDDLNYTNYEGNKLGRVEDANATQQIPGFTDKNNGGNDYAYDDNGGIYMDYNKGINYIASNHLNLPTSVDFGAKGTIEYQYDAAGNKMQKKVTDKTVSPYKITITRYAGAFVYTNSYLDGTTLPAETLEFIAQEEGRIRPAKIDPAQPLTAANTKYIYDYFMKDHLGNTRMVLTTEQQTDLYAATQEPANATKENIIFNNLSSYQTGKPNGFDGDGSNTNVTRLNGSDASKRVGPSIILKVMAGDIISLSTKAWYQTGDVSVPAFPQAFKQQVLDLLTAGIIGNNGTHGGSVPVTDILNGSSGVLDDFLNSRPTNAGGPRAFLNWMIVDEDFKKVNSAFHMGALPVQQTSSAVTLVGPANMTVRRNGWLYVYLSNESNTNVYFDDLVVNHKRGPVVETIDYYAFGLQIPGISSMALGFGGADNRYKYNGIEHDNDLNLNIDEAFYRNLDPATGRWWQIDPKVDAGYESISPYASMYNDPIRYSDPLGDEAGDGDDSPGFFSRLGSAIIDAGKQVVAATAGAANAWASNQVLGAGRVSSISSTGASYGTQVAYIVGQKIGDVASVVTGAIEDVAAAGGEIASLGIATPLAAPLAVHGTSVIGMGIMNLIKGSPAPTNNNQSDKKKINPPKSPPAKERVVNQKPGEKALNQSEGIGQAQDAAKKNKSPGQKKQTKINSTKKSDDYLRNVLRNTKTLKDARDNF